MDKKRNQRSPLKSWHPQWKDKLREKCLERVKKDRNQLLWKIRSAGKTLPASQDGAESAFGDILSDEIDRLKKRKDGESSNVRSDHDTMLWEYEPSEAFSELDHDDYEELMIAMQNILYEEMHEVQDKETLLLEDFEKSCEQEDDLLSTMLEQLQTGEKDGVLCPICKIGKLQQSQHLIYCSCGHLRLDVQHEKVDLEFLRKRLEELSLQHHNLGCRCQPVFCTDNRFSIAALYLQCSSCETFELVL